MRLPPERRFAGVLARHDGDVALVRESHVRWGGEFWSIPSGMVEAHETPQEGAVRELLEETGARVTSNGLVLRTRTSVRLEGEQLHSWNFEAEVDDRTLHVGDPDGLIREARWFSVEEAIAKLRRLPYRPLAEPAIATLLGESAGGTTLWSFDDPDSDPVVSRTHTP